MLYTYILGHTHTHTHTSFDPFDLLECWSMWIWTFVAMAYHNKQRTINMHKQYINKITNLKTNNTKISIKKTTNRSTKEATRNKIT